MPPPHLALARARLQQLAQQARGAQHDEAVHAQPHAVAALDDQVALGLRGVAEVGGGALQARALGGAALGGGAARARVRGAAGRLLLLLRCRRRSLRLQGRRHLGAHLLQGGAGASQGICAASRCCLLLSMLVQSIQRILQQLGRGLQR